MMIIWQVHYYQVMNIKLHFRLVSPPTLQILISIQITNAWWVRSSQRLFTPFLVSGDPIYLHSRLATQEVTNACVKLHDEIKQVEFTVENICKKILPLGLCTDIIQGLIIQFSSAYNIFQKFRS